MMRAQLDLHHQLEACRTELQEFTYTVSHDLRAPLRHINAFAQIIEEDWPDMPTEMAGHLATIRQSAQLLTQQLDGLTTLSRLGQQVPHLEWVEMSALVQGVLDDLVRQWPQRDIIWQLTPDLPTVWADAGMLRQVLALLLDNACKFTRHKHPAHIGVAWTALAGGQCCISVQDNGVGFNPGQAHQLFKVFARLHPQREFEGLGLGLVQCRKLLARMGGRISITGAPDGGCEVRLILPNESAI
jgi:signal transduction histidine kinase